MARIASEFEFIGPLGNLSAYKMRGVEGVVIRRKGGASKKKILKSPSFKLTRMHMLEFAGRATAAKYLRFNLHSMKPLADYNFTGNLNALMKPVQELDGKGVGKRSILLSKNPKILDGFSLNRTFLFESIVRNSLTWSLDREKLTARIEIPELIPGLTFVTSQRHAMYSIVAELGIMPDLVYNPDLNCYTPTHVDYDSKFKSNQTRTQWFPTTGGSPATVLDLAVTGNVPNNDYSLMLSIGIRYGAFTGNNEVKQVVHAGSAKIVSVV